MVLRGGVVLGTITRQRQSQPTCSTPDTHCLSIRPPTSSLRRHHPAKHTTLLKQTPNGVWSSRIWYEQYRPFFLFTFYLRKHNTEPQEIPTRLPQHHVENTPARSNREMRKSFCAHTAHNTPSRIAELLHKDRRRHRSPAVRTHMVRQDAASCRRSNRRCANHYI